MSILKKFLSKISLRSPESRAISETKGIIRDEAKIAKDIEEAKKGITGGSVDIVKKASNHQILIIEDKAERAERILVDLENVIRTQIILMAREIEAIEQATKPSPKKKLALIKHLKEEELDPLEQEFSTFLAEEASIENTNISLLKVLDKASQHRDQLYKTRELRRDTKVMRKDGKKIIRKTKLKNIDVTRIVEELDKDTLKAISDLNGAFKDNLISLQDDMAELTKAMEVLKSLKDTQGFPAEIANKEIEKITEIRKSVVKSIKEKQTSLTRLFLSEAERLEIEVKRAERDAQTATDREEPAA